MLIRHMSSNFCCGTCMCTRMEKILLNNEHSQYNLNNEEYQYKQTGNEQMGYPCHKEIEGPKWNTQEWEIEKETE